MASGDNKSHYAKPRRKTWLLIPASVISDDNNVEALVHGPQQREQIRQRAVMCSVMWLLRLLTIYRLAHLSASSTHTGEYFIDLCITIARKWKHKDWIQTNHVLPIYYNNRVIFRDYQRNLSKSTASIKWFILIDYLWIYINHVNCIYVWHILCTIRSNNNKHNFESPVWNELWV